MPTLPTQITNLWSPQIWVKELAEKIVTMPGLINSGVCVRTPEMDAIAEGAGISANVPVFKDVTDSADEPQVENTAPTNYSVVTSGLMVAPILNRVCPSSVTALSAQVSGVDPMGQVISILGTRRLKQRQATLVSILRGVFGTGGAANAAAAFSDCRLGGTTAERFDEKGTDSTADQRVDAGLFIDACFMLGELADTLEGGAFWCHPNIKASLMKVDADQFKMVQPSGLPFKITTYRGCPIYTSGLLVRAGTTDGYVYDSYILTPGSIGWGEKAQAGDEIAVASLQLDKERPKNNQTIYDRTRFLLHPNGAKWVGTPAGQSASDSELATATNWNLALTSAARAGIVAFRTNG